jgi:hypothetical protein
MRGDAPGQRAKADNDCLAIHQPDLFTGMCASSGNMVEGRRRVRSPRRRYMRCAAMLPCSAYGMNPGAMRPSAEAASRACKAFRLARTGVKSSLK